MSSPRIRPIETSDLDRLLEINGANVPNVGPVDLGQLRTITDESAIGLLVEADGEIAGFCLVLAPDAAYDSVNYRWFMERNDDAMYLDRVAFDQRFQGRGLGKILYADVERRIVEDHPTMAQLTLEVNVDPPNDTSLAFHAALDFEEVGRQMSHGIEVSLMAKPLR